MGRNGSVNDIEGTTLGSRVEFFCDDGFRLNGNRFRQCLPNGTWSGNVPTCEGILWAKVQSKNIGMN